MPRLYRPPPHDSYPGSLAVETRCEGYFDIFYVPSKERLEASGLPSENPVEHRVMLLQVDCWIQSLTIFPTKTRPHFEDFLKPKYDQIERIVIEDWEAPVILPEAYEDSDLENDEPLHLAEDDVRGLLERLPTGFVPDYDYGLGLTQRYRFIINGVRELSNCTKLVISPHHQTEIDEDSETFYLSLNDFLTIRKSIDRTVERNQSATRSANHVETRNFLAERLGHLLIPVKSARRPLGKTITELAAQEESLSRNEQEEVLGLLAKNTKSIAATKPDKLAALKNDIELVTLETLIERYEGMIQAKVPEKKWQDFLEANPFILGLAFGYPILKVGGQASVGGHKLWRTGETIADFLVKNSLTNNSAIIEIKTPSTKLLRKTWYRDGIYVPTADLVGALNQVLSQKHNFEGEIALIKSNSRITDLESYSVRCCLVIGTIPDDEERKKSFELFRGNSKNVEIVTFDELLEKLKRLRDLLKSPNPELGHVPQSIEDLPF